MLVPIGFNKAGAPPFTPLSLSGCVAWLRADLGVTQTSGIISTWANQAPGSSADAHGPSGNEPTLVTVGSYPAVHFNNSEILNWDLRLSGSKTIAHVTRVTGTSGSLYTLASADGSVCSEELYAYPSYSFLSYIDDTSFAANTGYSMTPGTTDPHSYVRSFDASTSAVVELYDGTAQTASGGNTIGRSAPLTSGIGGRPGAGFGFTGDILEFIVYDRVLSSGESTSLVGYFAARYGL